MQGALTTITDMGNSLLVGQDALTTITDMGNSLLVVQDALTTLYHVNVSKFHICWSFQPIFFRGIVQQGLLTFSSSSLEHLYKFVILLCSWFGLGYIQRALVSWVSELKTRLCAGDQEQPTITPWSRVYIYINTLSHWYQSASSKSRKLYWLILFWLVINDISKYTCTIFVVPPIFMSLVIIVLLHNSIANFCFL